VNVKRTVSRKRGYAPNTLEDHPLITLRSITVKLEWDPETRHWMTFIPELNKLSTFGKTREEALEHTRDLLRGYLETCQAHALRLPLTQKQIQEIRAAVG
jgi:predicted RNase H-like HicB family nuclease